MCGVYPTQGRGIWKAQIRGGVGVGEETRLGLEAEERRFRERSRCGEAGQLRVLSSV